MSATGKIARLVVAVFALTATARAQAAPSPTPSPSPPPPPATDIYIADLSAAGGTLKLGRARRVTEWEGYDNQPAFMPDGRAILYTSIRADNQADIYRYDFAAGATTRLTDTPEAEYSPTPAPDGKHFSVVRVEQDKDATQRLWQFPLAGGRLATLVLEKFKPVGYHVWADERTLGLFILGRPVTLQVVDARTGVYGIIATNVGRSLQRVPGTAQIAYVHKLGDGDWQIRSYDTRSHAKQTLTRTLPASEDFAWTPDGALLMAKDSKLYALRPGRDADWREVADFFADGLTSITRISVSPRGDRVALVARPPEATR
jgi:hypothetical protein